MPGGFGIEGIASAGNARARHAGLVVFREKVLRIINERFVAHAYAKARHRKIVVCIDRRERGIPQFAVHHGVRVEQIPGHHRQLLLAAKAQIAVTGRPAGGGGLRGRAGIHQVRVIADTDQMHMAQGNGVTQARHQGRAGDIAAVIALSVAVTVQSGRIQLVTGAQLHMAADEAVGLRLCNFPKAQQQETTKKD